MSLEGDERRTNTCEKCSNAIDDISIAVNCNNCSRSFHRSCVVINDNTDVWKCPQCSSKFLQPHAPKSNRSRRSVNSVNAVKLMEERTKILTEQENLLKEEGLQLQKIREEEELALRQVAEKKKERAVQMEISFQKRKSILAEKQKIIEETIRSVAGSSRASSCGSADVSRERTKQWVNDKSNQPTTTENKEEAQIQNNCPIVPQPFDISNPLNAKNAVTSTQTGAIPKPKKDARFEEYNGNASRRFQLTRDDIAARHVIKPLTKFNGNPKAWNGFISSYERSCGMGNFSNDENLERLRDCLSGDALTAVGYRLHYGCLADEIIDELRNLFGRPEFIIEELVKDLKTEPNPRIEDIDSLIKFALHVNNICSIMVSAKLSEHLWDPNLLKDMEKKLPAVLLMEWANHKNASLSKCNIESFSAWMKNKADSYISVLTKPPNLSPCPQRNKAKGSVNVHAVDKLCHGCKKPVLHRLEDCDVFKSRSYSDKWKTVKENSICRTCLSIHKHKKCKVDQVCGVEGCQYLHNKLLHKQNVEEKPNCHHVHALTPSVHFKVLPVVIECNGASLETYAMLDDGSSITIIDKDLAEELHLTGVKEPLCLKWTTGINKRDDTSQKVSFTIRPRNQQQLSFRLADVRTLKNLSLPCQSLNADCLAKKYTHLQNLPILSYEEITPKILIGNDNCKLSMVLKYKCGGANDPIACKTKLGWTICGTVNPEESYSFHVSKCPCVVQTANSSDDNLEMIMKDHYKLENLGIDSKTNPQMTDDDANSLKTLEKTIRFSDGHYEVGLLWKFSNVKIPKSFQMAKRRLLCLEKRYQEEPEMLNTVNNQIAEYVKKGYSVKLTAEEVRAFGDDCWYLPMFVVKNINKPSKLRLVWDAAAEVNGISLNKLLLKGPDLLSSLAGILIRFREFKIAVAGDIREMFHQVRISEDDQKYQLFLWRSDTQQEPDVYKMKVMTFGATCSPSSAQYVLMTNAKKFEQEKPKACEAIYNNHYVDDWLQSVETSDEAISLARDVKEIHERGGFEIRNWISNSTDLIDTLNDSNPGESKNLELASKYDKVLGLFWETSGDHFTFSVRRPLSSLDILEGKQKPTKRQVLQIMMSVFDPLGLISHILIYPKILIQMIWRSGIDWDSRINDDHFEHWQIWTKSLAVIENLKIPRWIGFSSKNSNVQLHVFVDAGEEGFAAAAYVRVITPEGIKCNLVSAKSKVSPLKPLSIPRLELQAAVIGARLAKFVNASFSKPVQEQYFWTDSKTVLSWINADLKKYKQFVSCRVAEIHELSSPKQWNWVCSKSNIADLATKLKIHDEDSFKCWYSGPKFLYDDYLEEWKNKIIDVPFSSEELRPQYEASMNFHSVAFPTKFSSWHRLSRSMAFAIRFATNLLNSTRGEPIAKGILSAVELTKAEDMLYSQAQSEGYPDEYAALENNVSSVGKNSPTFKDNPFLDSSKVMRANSRLEFAAVEEIFKKPVILPRDHAITDLIVRHYHLKYHHLNHETVINEIRQRYVIPRLRTKLKIIRGRCQLCKIKSAKPSVPLMSPLPPARLSSFTQPFTFTGIDFFGPMYVTVHRRKEKRWMLLFTCLTTRAVHVEITASLTTSSCIICIRNFTCRRGTPRQIHSDNGTSFKGACNELKEQIRAINKDEVASKFVSAETEWIFIPPASPHMGGSWERMVRSIKTTLKAILPEGSIPEEVLRSLLCEAEHVVNSRPLTYVPIDSENEEALTPNHFLLGSSCGVKPLGQLNDDANYLRNNWHKTQHLSNAFWRRWTKEYMPTLCRRTKWLQQSKDLLVDDIVIIVGEDERGKWPKGRVLEVIKSRDGKVRSAKVQTATGIYVRPASKLAVLDVGSDSIPVSNTEIPGGGVTNTKQSHPMVRRSNTKN